MSVVRLAVCDHRPFTYVMGDKVFGPWVAVALSALPDGSDPVFVTVNACNSAGMLASLAADEADVAVHPMLLDGGGCAACTWTFPVSNNGHVFVSAYEAPPFTSLLFDHYTRGAWLLVSGIVLAFVVSAIVMERRRAGFMHVVFGIMSLTNNLTLADDYSAATHVLYVGMAICCTLMVAVYTADLTSWVLQEKEYVGVNVKALLAAGERFSVVEGGAAEQMVAQYPTALPGQAYDVVPAGSVRDELPCMMPWEMASMLRGESCDPMGFVTGHLTRVPHTMVFRSDWEGGARFDAALRDLSLRSYIQTATTAWIDGRYRCVQPSAVRIDTNVVAPLMLVTAGVYAMCLVTTALASAYKKWHTRMKSWTARASVTTSASPCATTRPSWRSPWTARTTARG